MLRWPRAPGAEFAASGEPADDLSRGDHLGGGPGDVALPAPLVGGVAAFDEPGPWVAQQGLFDLGVAVGASEGVDGQGSARQLAGQPVPAVQGAAEGLAAVGGGGRGEVSGDGR